MSNLKDEYASYEKHLGNWIKSLGLPVYRSEESEVETILQLDRGELKLSKNVELSEYVVILAQYAIFLQHKTNECRSFLKWCSQVGPRLEGNDRSRMTQWVRKVELRDLRLAYLTRRIEMFGQSISNLVRARYNERNV